MVDPKKKSRTKKEKKKKESLEEDLVCGRQRNYFFGFFPQPSFPLGFIRQHLR